MRKVVSVVLAIMMMLSITLPVLAKEYVVQPGDMLWKIARDHDMTVEQIVELNNIKDANRIYSGQVLNVSGLVDNGVPVEDRRRPLRILVVNDDGIDAIGVQLLHDELSERGYEVITVAPLTNKSGIGTAITYGKDSYELVDFGDNKFGFEGTPVDCFRVATGALMEEQPDLVISGVNDGPNFGEAQMNSGTVGGAARAVRHGYPGIAASLTFIPGMMGKAEELEIFMVPAVEYVANMVDELNEEWQAGNMMMPLGTGLSINYPALPAEKIRGVEYIQNPDVYKSVQTFKKDEETGEIVDDADWGAFMSDVQNPEIITDYTLALRGYVTVSVIDANWNAEQSKVDYMKAVLKDLKAYE